MTYNVFEQNSCSTDQKVSNSELTDHLPITPDWFLIDQCDNDNIIDFLDGIYAYNKYIIDIGFPSFMTETYLPLNLPKTQLDIDFDSFNVEQYHVTQQSEFKDTWKPKHLASPALIQSSRNDLEDLIEIKREPTKRVSFRDVLNSKLKPEEILRTNPAPTPKSGCTYSLGIFSFNKTVEFQSCRVNVRNAFSSEYVNMLHITKNKYNTFKNLSLECLSLLESKYIKQDFFDVGEIDDRYKEFGFDRIILNSILDKLCEKDRKRRSFDRTKVLMQARNTKRLANNVVTQGFIPLIPDNLDISGIITGIKDMIASSFELVKKKVEDIMKSLVKESVKSTISELWDSYKWWLVCLLVSLPVVNYIFKAGKDAIVNNLGIFEKLVVSFITDYLPSSMMSVSSSIITLFTWPFKNEKQAQVDEFWDDVVPQATQTDNSEKHCQHPFINTIMDALINFTRQFTGVTNFSINPRAIMNILKFVGHVPSYKKGLDVMCEWLVTFLEKVVNYYRYYVLGKTDYMILRKILPVYDNWRKDVFSTYNTYLNGELPVDLDSKSIVDDLYVRGRDLASRKDVIETDSSLKSMIPPLMKIVEEMKNRMSPISPEANNVKFEPLCICLQGKSGVGKSAMTVPLLNELIVRLSAKDISKTLLEHQSAYIYSRNAEQDFWDGYYNQFACVYDDFLQKVDIAGGESEALEIIKAVNEYQYALHSASIEDKGNVFFSSKIVLCTTNDANLNSNTIKEPEALKRRFHFMVEVIPAPNYAIRSKSGNHNVLDINKLAEKGSGFVTDAILLRVSTGTHGADSVVHEYTYEEFVDVCVHQYRVLQMKNAQRMTDVKDRIERALFSRVNNCDYVPKANVTNKVDTARKQVTFFQSNSNDDDADGVYHDEECIDDGSDEFARGVIRDKINALKIDDGRTNDGEAGDSDIIMMDELAGSEMSDEGFESCDEDFDSDGDITNVVGLIAKKYKNRSSYFGASLNNAPKQLMVNHFYKTIILIGACLHICPKDMSVEMLKREPDILYDVSGVCKIIFQLVDKLSTMRRQPVDIDILCQCLSSERLANMFNGIKFETAGMPPNEACLFLKETLFNRITLKALSKQYHRNLSDEKNKNETNRIKRAFNEVTIKVGRILDEIEIRYDLASEKSGWNKYLMIFVDAILIIGAGKLVFKGLQLMFGKPVPPKTQNSGASTTTSNDSNVRSSIHKSMNSWRNSMRSAKRVSLQATGNYDANMFELGKRVYLNNTYDFLVPEADNKVSCLGKLLFVGGANAIMPLHFASMVSAAVKNGDLEWDDSLYIRQTDTETLSAFPAKIVDRTKFEILPNSRDWCMINFGKIVTPKPNLVNKFISNNDRAKLHNNMVAVWLGRGEWKNIPMAKCITMDSVVTHIRNNYVVNFQKLIAYDIHTTEGDCGSLITISNPNFSNKIVGIHVSGDNKSTGFGQTITSEELHQVMQSLKVKLYGNQVVPQYGAAKYDIDEVRIQSANDANTIVEIEREHYSTPINEKSKLVKTRMEQIYNIEGDRAKLAPFKNEEGVLVNPYDVALSKYCELKNWNPDYGCLDVACNDAAKHVLKGIIPAGSEIRPNVLSFEQAVCGEAGLPFFDSIVRGTSPGYPYNTAACKMNSRGKFGIFGSNQEFDLSTEQAVALKQQVMDYIDAAKQGKIYSVYYTDSLKDEIRTIKKVREGRTRLVSGSPLVLTVVTRMYFMQVCRYLYTNRIANGMAVGCNPLSNDWNILYNLLCNCSSENVFSGDFKNFDGSERPYLLSKCGEILTSWYGLPDMHSDSVVRMTIISDLYNSVHIRGSRMYVWDGSLASGNPLTSVVNSLYNQIAFRYTWECLRVETLEGKHGPKTDIGFFDGSVYLCTYGDDNILSVRDNVKHFYNPELIRMKMIDLGLTLTSSDKEATGLLDFDDIYEVDFLKRCFSYSKHGKLIGALPLASIFKPLVWVKKGAPEFSRIIECLDGIKIELSAHGKTVYNEWMSIIISLIFERYGETILFESYEQICSRY